SGPNAPSESIAIVVALHHRGGARATVSASVAHNGEFLVNRRALTLFPDGGEQIAPPMVVAVGAYPASGPAPGTPGALGPMTRAGVGVSIYAASAQLTTFGVLTRGVMHDSVNPESR